MTEQELQEIESRLPKGEWRATEGSGSAYHISGPDIVPIGRILAKADAEFVVHAADDIRALLALVRSLKGKQSPVGWEWVKCEVEPDCWILNKNDYYMGIYPVDAGGVKWFIDDKKLNRCLFQGSADNAEQAKMFVQETFMAEIQETA